MSLTTTTDHKLAQLENAMIEPAARAVVRCKRRQPTAATSAECMAATDCILCLVGPPASGKTVLASRLQHGAGVAIVRPRTILAAAARLDTEIDRAIATTTDHLGWVSDEVLDAAFRAVLIPAHPLGDALRRTRVLAFDNFPGRASQVAMLVAHVNDPASALWERRVATIALDASDAEIGRRAASRRICQKCDESTTSERCTACGKRTARRSDDDPDVLRAKLARYRANASEMMSALTKVGPMAGPRDYDRTQFLRTVVGEGAQP